MAVRTLSRHVTEWVGRLGRVWVEGQVAQLNRRPGMRTVYLTVRDSSTDVSISDSGDARVVDAAPLPVTEGSRVVLHVKPEVWVKKTQLQFTAYEIRPVGIGELLLQLERRRQQLAAEGLFDADRKRALPFLPRLVGLVTGRAGAALHDVVETGQRRWPGVRFSIREVAVQGHSAAAECSAAVRALDADPEVDVIIIARGGGSVEDLLPFSDELLLRTVAAALTPVVSAIGHEPDSPLLDLVADLRAATPTDAARRVVPDLAEELHRLAQLRSRLATSARNRLEREATTVAHLRQRLGHPTAQVDLRQEDLGRWAERLHRAPALLLDRLAADLAGAAAGVRTLSPQGVLDRGYAVVQDADGSIVRSPVSPGVRLRIRLAQGELRATAD
jgi:exodeoxyribonuclease VII large subunit